MNLTHPVTSESSRRLAEWLLKHDFEALFLDLPQGSERTLLEAAHGGGELGGQLRFYTPLVESIPTLESRGVQVHCYLSPTYSRLSEKLTYEVVGLGVRARLGRIEVDRWRRVLEQGIITSMSYAREHAQYIVSRAKRVNVCVNLPVEVGEELSRLGLSVVRVVIEESCRPTEPLYEMVRESLLSGKPFDAERAKGLIREYAEFLGLVMEKGFDEAYTIWKHAHGCG